METITEVEAIKRQKKAANASTTHYQYTDDATTLTDFMIVHWAIFVEEE